MYVCVCVCDRGKGRYVSGGLGVCACGYVSGVVWVGIQVLQNKGIKMGDSKRTKRTNIEYHELYEVVHRLREITIHAGRYSKKCI